MIRKFLSFFFQTYLQNNTWIIKEQSEMIQNILIDNSIKELNFNQEQIVDINTCHNKEAIRQHRQEIEIPASFQNQLFHKRTVQSVLIAERNSFVFVYYSQVIHFSKQWKYLKHMKMSGAIKTAQAVSPTLILILLEQKDKYVLYQWNLSNGSYIAIDFYRQQKNGQVQLFVFPITKHACVIEYQNKFEKKQKLRYWANYYRYPLVSFKDKPFDSFGIQTNYQLAKLNNCSKICWFSSGPQWSPFLEVLVYEPGLKKQGKAHANSYRFSNNFHKYPNLCISKIVDMWEVKEKVFFVSVETKFDLNEGAKRCFNAKKKKQATREETRLSQKDFQSSEISANLRQIQKQYDFMWDYSNDRIRQCSYNIQKSHQIQFFDDFRQLDRQKAQESESIEERIRLKKTYGSNLDKNVRLPVTFLHAQKQNQKLICLLKKQEIEKSFWFKKKIHFYLCPIYKRDSYFHLKIHKRKITEVEQTDQNMEQSFQELSCSEEQQEKKEQVLEKEKKVENEIKICVDTNQKIPYQYLLTVQHIKIKFFRYTLSEMAVWALENIILQCDEDLLYYVCELLN